MRRISLGLVAIAASIAIAGCAPGQHVDLPTVFDEEAADILTNQQDATDDACEADVNCEQAVTSDQADIYSFDNASTAEDAAPTLDGEVVADRYVIVWTDDTVSESDRAFVRTLLETAHRSD